LWTSWPSILQFLFIRPSIRFGLILFKYSIRLLFLILPALFFGPKQIDSCVFSCRQICQALPSFFPFIPISMLFLSSPFGQAFGI
jgi:hypothetical protein